MASSVLTSDCWFKLAILSLTPNFFFITGLEDILVGVVGGVAGWLVCLSPFVTFFSKCKFEKCVSYTENRVLYTVFRVAYTAHFRGFGGDYKI